MVFSPTDSFGPTDGDSTSNAPSASLVGTHSFQDRSSLEYVSMPSGSIVTCRVCQDIIDIENKREQHVVKCPHCSEATV